MRQDRLRNTMMRAEPWAGHRGLWLADGLSGLPLLELVHCRVWLSESIDLRASNDSLGALDNKSIKQDYLGRLFRKRMPWTVRPDILRTALSLFSTTVTPSLFPSPSSFHHHPSTFTMSLEDQSSSLTAELEDPRRVDLLQRIQEKLGSEVPLVVSLALWFADIENLERFAGLDWGDLYLRLDGPSASAASRSPTDILIGHCKDISSLTI